MSGGKSKRAKEERERFATMAEAELIELRNVSYKKINVLMQEKNQLLGTIGRVDAELEARKSADAKYIVVTDHAVVRYLERMMGVDVEGVRRQIMDMTNRSVRRDGEFMDDPETGCVVVCTEGTHSVATVLTAMMAGAPAPKAGKAAANGAEKSA